MNVLVFTTLYPNNVWPNHGVFIKERMSRFAGQGGNTTKVVAPVPWFPPIKLGHRFKYTQVRQEERIEGLEVHHPRYLMIPKVGMALHGLMIALSVLPRVRKIRKEFDFDLIDAHYVYPDGFAAVCLGRLLNKPVVVSARGSDITLFPERRVIRGLIRYTLRKAARIVAVSRALGQAVARLGIPEQKVSVIPNGVDAVKFQPVPRESARAELGLPEGRTILSVGKLTPNKGFALILEALRILADRPQLADLSLVIVGEGEQRPELERQVAALGLDGRVRFTGSVPHERLRLWYSAADVFCLASEREGWPNVLLESMACGTPVVATSIWGIPEVVPSDDLGILVERDPGSIAEGLQGALEKSWNADDIVRYARGRDWDRTAHSLQALFATVLEPGAESAGAPESRAC